MKTVNEQIAEMQKDVQKNMNSVAAEAFERIARKNYDLMGDLVEYAVAQVKLPSAESNLQDVYEQRVADTKAFADKVNTRAAEYVALAGELGEMVTATASEQTPASKISAQKAPAAKKKPAAKKRAAKA